MPISNPGVAVPLSKGRIDLFLAAVSAIGQGTWAAGAAGTNHYIGQWQNTGGDGDNVSYDIYLDKGTYTLGMMALKGAGQGILDIDVDAVEVASFDLYDAGNLFNEWMTQTSIVIAAAGRKTLKLRLDGKNGSSSGYQATLNLVSMWRTL